MLIVFLLAAVALVCATPGPASAARKHKVAFGAWTPDSPFGGNLSAIDGLESRIHRRVKIVNWFQDWGSSHFRWNVKKAVKGVRRSGRIPMLTWEPYKPGPWDAYSNQAISGGAYDGYIRRWARGVKRLHTPVYVRFAHEFNGNWYPWGGPVNDNSARSFKAMWRHVVDVTRGAGAKNIRWVWSPLNDNVPNFASNRFQRYYPGRGYVDVLALDGYNWGGGTPQYGGWRSFHKIFSKAYKRIRRLGPQPVWIAEVGSASDGGNKSRWVRKMFRQAARWKRMKAIVWFDQDKDRDWSTTSAASAFSR